MKRFIVNSILFMRYVHVYTFKKKKEKKSIIHLSFHKTDNQCLLDIIFMVMNSFSGS